MKKWIFLGLVFAGIGGAWLYLRTVSITPLWNQPKFAKLTRGNLRVPITAPGLIEPAQRIEVKSEASGMVLETPVREGDFVKAGDPLIILRKIDEQRNVDRAKAAVDKIEALIEQAKIAEKTSQANVLVAQARADELSANLQMAKFDLDKEKNLAATSFGRSSEQGLVNVQARFDVTAAQLKAAQAQQENALLSIEDAKANIKSQQASFRDASKALEDAEFRLSKTTIISAYNAIVTELAVKNGMLVQSATTSLMSGSPVITLADLSSLRVRARVDEADIGRIYSIAPPQALPDVPGLRETQSASQPAQGRGGAVKITIDAFPDQTFEGVIDRVEPQGKLNAGSAIIQFDVHVRITDERRYLLPLGAQAQVEFTVQQAQDALLAPADAIKTNQGERGVWVKLPGSAGSSEKYGKKFVPCRVGITDGANTQILSTVTGDPLEVGAEVFTKLPPDTDDHKS